MVRRTFAIGDIHGDLDQLDTLFGRLPPMEAEDSLVFLGDYIDRGPRSRQVVEYLRALPGRTAARIVTLRGNHEDAWLRVIDDGWPGFVHPLGNGCRECLRSYRGGNGSLDDGELQSLLTGSFFPREHVEWMRHLPYWYEDEHAIYVHAGLPDRDGHFVHPSEAPEPETLLWVRSQAFLRGYRGKRVVFGHTVTRTLPPELSCYTPDDRSDLWAGQSLYGLDTGCGKGGFLTALELPRLVVYESR